MAWSYISGGTLTARTDPDSANITVPADAELMVLGLSFYNGGTPAGTPNPTLDSVSMSKIAGADASASYFQGPGWYIVNPTTGASVTLAWDFTSGIGSDGNAWVYEFYKGIDTASPLKSSDGTQAAGTPYTTGSVSAASGDLCVMGGGGYLQNGTDDWSGSTNVTPTARNNTTDYRSNMGIADGTPSGNVTAQYSNSASSADGHLWVAIFNIPAAGGGDVRRTLQLSALGVG